MSVHIDEVEGKMEAESAAPNDAGSPAPPSGDPDPYKLRMELARLAQRNARLRAD